MSKSKLSKFNEHRKYLKLRDQIKKELSNPPFCPACRNPRVVNSPTYQGDKYLDQKYFDCPLCDCRFQILRVGNNKFVKK